ncbi:Ubiquitin carboxyl-terminal hydrolase MINDY-2 [Tritrichomonas musculus]|uniref:Ubiquitin carboxyl-terminal hydrolase MINDY-2 n=1 Tax=Tritrichomonas musculus TaxID=1915356 RepID=A0ABR2I6A2_9EUKA
MIFSLHFLMEVKKKSFVFQTKTIYFPPLGRKVNILLQHRDGPCMLIAIFNSLAIQGRVSIDSGIYPSSSIIEIIKSCNSDVHGLNKLVNGYYVNPSFSSCTDFQDYPDFLQKLNIQLVHAMTPSKKQKNYDIISKYNYDSMIVRLIDLQSEKPCSDELKALRAWNSKLRKQVTTSGIEDIESQIKEGEVQIFFRNSHFACIYKYLNHVYSLITCRGLGGKNCAWHSLPSANGEFQYYDENFNITFCQPWDSNSTKDKSKQKQKSYNTSSSPEMKTEIKHKKQHAKNNDCTIF